MSGQMKWWRCPKCSATRMTDLEFPVACYTCQKITYNDGPLWSGPYDTEAEAKGGKKKPMGPYACILCGSTYESANDARQCRCAPKPPDERWWRCKGCGYVGCLDKKNNIDYNDCEGDGVGMECGHYSCYNRTWHGPFATRQAAEEPDLLFGPNAPKWEAHTDHTSGVLWKTDPGWLKDHLEHVKSMFERPWLTVDMSSSKAYKDEMSSIIPKSKEDTDMSAIFCDGCRKAFPVDETQRLTFEAMKFGRSADSAVSIDTAKQTFLCDECFATLMAEPMVAKLPWTTWRKGDDDD